MARSSRPSPFSTIFSWETASFAWNPILATKCISKIDWTSEAQRSFFLLARRTKSLTFQLEDVPNRGINLFHAHFVVRKNFLVLYSWCQKWICVKIWESPLSWKIASQSQHNSSNPKIGGRCLGLNAVSPTSYCRTRLSLILWSSWDHLTKRLHYSKRERQWRRQKIQCWGRWFGRWKRTTDFPRKAVWEPNLWYRWVTLFLKEMERDKPSTAISG